MSMTEYRAMCAELLALPVAASVWAICATVSQCNAIGGTTVRGLFWLECIK